MLFAIWSFCFNYFFFLPRTCIHFWIEGNQKLKTILTQKSWVGMGSPSGSKAQIFPAWITTGRSRGCPHLAEQITSHSGNIPLRTKCFLFEDLRPGEFWCKIVLYILQWAWSLGWRTAFKVLIIHLFSHYTVIPYNAIFQSDLGHFELPIKTGCKMAVSGAAC